MQLLRCNIDEKRQTNYVCFFFFLFFNLKTNVYEKSKSLALFYLFTIIYNYLQLITIVYNSQCYNYIVNNILSF